MSTFLQVTHLHLDAYKGRTPLKLLNDKHNAPNALCQSGQFWQAAS
jgi:hypothetical protein